MNVLVYSKGYQAALVTRDQNGQRLNGSVSALRQSDWVMPGQSSGIINATDQVYSGMPAGVTEIRDAIPMIGSMSGVQFDTAIPLNWRP